MTQTSDEAPAAPAPVPNCNLRRLCLRLSALADVSHGIIGWSIVLGMLALICGMLLVRSLWHQEKDEGTP